MFHTADSRTSSPTNRLWLCGALLAIASPVAAQDWKDMLVSFVAGTANQKAVQKHQAAWIQNWDAAAAIAVSLRTKVRAMLAGVKDAEGRPEKDAVQAAAETLHKLLVGGADAELGKSASAKDAVDRSLRRVAMLRLGLVRAALIAGRRTGARYAGQYAGLKKLGDDVPEFLLGTVEDPPQQVSDADRGFMLGAIRDVTKKLTDKQISRVEELAKDEFEDEGVQKQAMYLLWHCGNKDLLKAVIAGLEAQAKKEGDAQSSLIRLANVWWEIREYRNAVGVYKRITEGVVGMPDPQMGSMLYNMACSQALAGDIDEAFATLDKSLTKVKGTSAINDQLLRVDHDINALRKDPRFWELMKKHERDIKKPSDGKSEKTVGRVGE